MKYVSTRGEAKTASFNEALIEGLARDGGLYVPETWPQISQAEIAGSGVTDVRGPHCWPII